LLSNEFALVAILPTAAATAIAVANMLYFSKGLDLSVYVFPVKYLFPLIIL
jgi:hypothetical protein